MNEGQGVLPSLQCRHAQGECEVEDYWMGTTWLGECRHARQERCCHYLGAWREVCLDCGVIRMREDEEREIEVRKVGGRP